MKTMTNTYVVIFFVGFTFRSLLSFQIYIYIEFTVLDITKLVWGQAGG
jgi:hypothetical protein